VFNFFSPFYSPPGEIRDSGLVAPELQIASEYQNTYVSNFWFFQTFGLNQTNPDLQEDDIFIDISEEMAVAADADALVDMIADKLLAGEISSPLRQEIINIMSLIPDSEAALRAAEAIYLVVSSPEFAYQK